MSTGQRVDRQAWARVVRNLVSEQTRGKVAPFARKVGVNPRTVTRWLDAEVDVSEESVREVAAATGHKAMDLLVEVGYYRRVDVAHPAAADDIEVRLILEAPVDEPTRQRMLEHLAELRERDRDRRIADLRWMIERSQGA